MLSTDVAREEGSNREVVQHYRSLRRTDGQSDLERLLQIAAFSDSVAKQSLRGSDRSKCVHAQLVQGQCLSDRERLSTELQALAAVARARAVARVHGQHTGLADRGASWVDKLSGGCHMRPRFVLVAAIPEGRAQKSLRLACTLAVACRHECVSGFLERLDGTSI